MPAHTHRPSIRLVVGRERVHRVDHALKVQVHRGCAARSSVDFATVIGSVGGEALRDRGGALGARVGEGDIPANSDDKVSDFKGRASEFDRVVCAMLHRNARARVGIDRPRVGRHRHLNVGRRRRRRRRGRRRRGRRRRAVDQVEVHVVVVRVVFRRRSRRRRVPFHALVGKTHEKLRKAMSRRVRVGLWKHVLRIALTVPVSDWFLLFSGSSASVMP